MPGITSGYSVAVGLFSALEFYLYFIKMYDESMYIVDPSRLFFLFFIKAPNQRLYFLFTGCKSWGRKSWVVLKMFPQAWEEY